MTATAPPPPAPTPPAGAVTVVRVWPDTPVPHLAAGLDYAVPEKYADQVALGVMVTIYLAGQATRALIVELNPESDYTGNLRPFTRVTSPYPVLSPNLIDLIRSLSQRQVGLPFALVTAAITARHAGTEKSFRAALADTRLGPEREPGPGLERDAIPAVLHPLCDTLADTNWLVPGSGPRAVWHCAPTAGYRTWAAGFIGAAAAVINSGGQVAISVPTAASIAVLKDVISAAKIDKEWRIAYLSSELGPAARHRRHLQIGADQVDLVIGTRAAVWADLPRLRLIAIWDDDNDRLRLERAPYIDALTVAVNRCARGECGLLIAGWSVSLRAQLLVESRWATPIGVDRQALRATGIRRQVLAEAEVAAAYLRGQSHFPPRARDLVIAAAPGDGALIITPRAGYMTSLRCDNCSQILTCPACAAHLQATPEWALTCPNCDFCAAAADFPGPGDAPPVTGQDAPAVCGCENSRPRPRTWRAQTIGAGRIIADMRTMFGWAEVIDATGDNQPIWPPAAPASADGGGPRGRITVATPERIPLTPAGYGAVIILEAGLLATSARLWAQATALTRWCDGAAHLAPGGQALVLGDHGGLGGYFSRWDGNRWAGAQLQERRELGLPPTARYVKISASPDPIPLTALDRLTAQVRAECAAGQGFTHPVTVLGPNPTPTGGGETLVAFHLADADAGSAYLSQLRCAAARAGEPLLRWEVDPRDL